MRGVRLVGPNRFAYHTDIKGRKLGPGEVRIQVKSAGLCGSDLALFEGKNPFAKYPLIPGHEFSGEITEVDRGSSFKTGDRVCIMPATSCGQCSFCLRGEINHCQNLKIIGVHLDGGFVQSAVVKENQLHLLPNGISFNIGALMEPIAVAIHCIERGEVSPGKRIAVFGSGPIGILITRMAYLKRAEYIVTTDLFQNRLKMAKFMGAHNTFNVAEGNFRDFFKKIERFDTVFDVVGSAETLREATEIAKPAGKIVIVAVPSTNFMSFDIKNIFAKELVVKGSRIYTDHDYVEAISTLQNGKVDATKLITAVYPLEKIKDALEAARKNKGKNIKIMLEP